VSGALASWVDGTPGDTLPAVDRGLQYGDGVFETVLLRAGRARFLDLHLARLRRGCQRLDLRFDAFEGLRADIAAALAQAPPLAVLKILVSRGSATRRGYAPAGDEIARRVVSLWPAPPLSPDPGGVDLVWSPHPCGDDPALAGIKHLNRLGNVLAAAEAQARGAFDAVMRAGDGRLVSGAMSNLFLVTRRGLITPEVDRAGVAGVMRAVVLREAATLGLLVTVGHITPEDLVSADEAFLTNARIGVVPVRRLGEHRFAMNHVCRRIAAHVEALDA
jgi:4-amino-4-deoxychorismate lyase